jgi:hypothetical protein
MQRDCKESLQIRQPVTALVIGDRCRPIAEQFSQLLLRLAVLEANSPYICSDDLRADSSPVFHILPLSANWQIDELFI